MRGEAAELVDERHELVDVVLGDVAGLFGGLVGALVLRGADDGGAVGLADDFDGVGGGAWGVVRFVVEEGGLPLGLLTREGLLKADGEFTRGRGSHGARHVDVNRFGVGWSFT